MKILLIAVVCLLLVAAPTLGAGSLTTTYNLTIWPGINWVAVQGVPLNPNPASIFAGLNIANNLTRFNPVTQTSVVYDPAQPNVFGSILLGDGYTVSNAGTEPVTVSFEGIADGVPDAEGNMTDMWLSLPGYHNYSSTAGGMHWIGNPFAHSVAFSGILVTDGTVTLPLQQAVDRRWLDGVWQTWDGRTQSEVRAGLAAYAPDDTYLRPGSMYKVPTYKHNIALIIPAAVPEPSGVAVLLSGLAVSLGFIRRKR